MLLKKARFPRTNVAAKELENAIARWEADIQVYEKATSETFPATHRRMSLEDMCPERLRAHLRANGPERYPSYDDLRIAISDWLADEVMHASKGGKALGVIGGVAEETTEGDWEYEEVHVYVPESESWVLGLAPKRPRTEEPEQPEAEMKVPPGGKSAGKGKGKKGKGKGKAAPAAGCWGCGGPHFQRDCPKGGEAGGGAPTPAAWNSWFPGQYPVNKQTWNAWRPKGKGSRGKG